MMRRRLMNTVAVRPLMLASGLRWIARVGT